MRLGFNSPGAMASVNHLHWHLYYFDHKMVIEDLPVKDHLLQDWPAPAIVFELNHLTSVSISQLARKVMKIVDFCLDDGQIAYNLFLSRTGTGSIRLFVWLVEPRFGIKDSHDINVAFCEFSGYFICKTEQMFEQLDELDCVQVMQSVKSLHHRVLHLL